MKRLAIILLSLFLIGSTGCAKEEDSHIEHGIDYAEAWKSSALSFGNYYIDMPPYEITEKDYIDMYKCSYKGKEIPLYCFKGDPQGYSGGVIDGEGTATTVSDVLFYIEKNLDIRFEVMTHETAKFEYTQTVGKNTNGINYTYIEMTNKGEKYIGQMFMLSSTSSYFWFVKESEGLEMFNDIFSSIYEYDDR